MNLHSINSDLKPVCGQHLFRGYFFKSAHQSQNQNSVHLEFVSSQFTHQSYPSCHMCLMKHPRLQAARAQHVPSEQITLQSLLLQGSLSTGTACPHGTPALPSEPLTSLPAQLHVGLCNIKHRRISSEVLVLPYWQGLCQHLVSHVAKQNNTIN